MYRSLPCHLLGTILAFGAAGPSQISVYKHARGKLRHAHGYRVQVWQLDANGRNGKLDAELLFDRKRGFVLREGGDLTIGNLRQVWKRTKDGKTSISKRSDFEEPDFRELHVGPDEAPWDSWGDAAVLTQFDGRKCYRLDPMSNEDVSASAILYFDAKTYLPAGYTEQWHGEWSATYAYRALTLNPTTTVAMFRLPKSRRR